jgi:DNA-binding response OmpR family regulator
MSGTTAPAKAASELKILIVEDEFFLALEMEMCLLDAGHRVVGHGVNLHTALAVADEDKPDLALIDLRLSEGASGLDVAAGLKDRGVACLFVTAACAAEFGSDLALGCLHKPVNDAALLQAVDVARGWIAGALAAPVPHGMHLFGQSDRRAEAR